MIVIKNPDILQSASTLRRAANFVKHQNSKTRRFEIATNLISNDMPEAGGGGESAGAPEVASDDDDGGDDDGEPARSRPHSKTSPKPGTASASKKHFGLTRSRTIRHQAEKPPEFKIAIGEFDLAESIGMSVEFLRKDRSGKRLIPFYRIGTAIRYNPTRVSEALASLEEGGYTPKPKAKKSVNALSAR